jgi:hypothetical protein
MGLVHILSALRMLDVQRTGLAEGAATLLICLGTSQQERVVRD